MTCYVPVNVNLVPPLPPPRLTQNILTEKRFVCQNCTMPLAFTIRIPSQNISISTICNVRMTLERIAVRMEPCHAWGWGGGSGFTLTGALQATIYFSW